VSLDVSNVDPAEFAKAVASTPDEQLAAGMQSEARSQILDEIFQRMGDHAVAERIAGVDAIVHFEITGGRDGASDFYEIVIRNGKFAVNRQSSGPARVTLTIDGVAFLKMAAGAANGPELFMQGRLKLAGDMVFATQIATFFTLPSA
jgi:putative sterol carrier protein